VRGLRLRVATLGSGSPVLLVNGLGARLETWTAIAAGLADAGHRVLMFDAPGTGGSPTPRRPLRMPELAGVVVALLDQLGEPTVDVIGYSWGGILAQQLAHDAPHRLRRLALVATTPGLGAQPPALATVLAMSTPWYFLFGGYRSEWLNRPPRPLGYAAQLYAITGWSSLPWLHRIRRPTLVLSGADDPLVPVRNARLLAARIPDARLDVRAGAGHLWLLEHTEQSIPTLVEFLDPPGADRDQASLSASPW
jgi:pimeloyl-ACP methyl ester carboxylesterase